METPTQQKKFGVRFGALVDKIKTQLESQNLIFDRDEVKRFQAISNAITTLNFHNIIAPSVAQKSYDKLFKKIEKHIRKKN